MNRFIGTQRSNGLAAMIKQMKLYALAFMAKEQKKRVIMSEGPSLKEIIVDTLKTVYDPEIPVDIYELGLIYEINVYPVDNVYILMTLTSPACPAAEIIPVEVEQKSQRDQGCK